MLDPNLHPQPFQQLQLNPISESLKADLSWLTGNITPISWYQHIRTPATPTKPKGSPDAIAVALLSDIMYWYRPTEIRAEGTGQVLGYTQKFSADQLQKSYQSYATMFGVSKNKVKESFDLLEDLKLINREFRVVTLPISGLVLSNVMFIEPILNNVRKISTPPKSSKPKTPALQQSKGVSPIKGGGGYQTKGGVAPRQKGGDKYGEYAEISHTTTTENPTSVSSPITSIKPTSLSSSPFIINDIKEQKNIVPVENSQVITNITNDNIITKNENERCLSEIRSELINLVPANHHQPIIIKFVHETLKSGINSDTVKSAILYTNAHSKGNTKQYRSYLGKTLENPNWHIGYLELVELENQQKQEIENLEALKIVQEHQERKNQLLKKQQQDEERERESKEVVALMDSTNIDELDKFIETECWSDMNKVMRNLWKQGARHSIRRLHLKKFIAANGIAIVANSVLPAIATPLESPVQVQRPKSSLTSLSFIMPDLIQEIRPQPTA